MPQECQPSSRDLIFPGIAVAATLLLTGGAILLAYNAHTQVVDQIAKQPTVEAMQRGDLVVLDLGQPVPGNDPFSPLWEQAPAKPIPVQAQNITMPMLEKPTISSVTVQGLTDGKWIAWRLQWEDATADMNVDVDRFCDAVAIQFPLVPNASPFMGANDMPVQIIHWKALWQKDIDEHFQDVQDLHPNYWTDLYWFARQISNVKPGEVRYRVPDSFDDPRSLDWFPAYQAGNPMADFHRKQPVQELIAEGFGSLTPQKDSASLARGVWRDGKWTVVFSRPLRTTDPMDTQFSGAPTRLLSVAVWQGADGGVGGRKHWSQWFPFFVEMRR